MAIFRVEKTRDYTVMANHHLKNSELSLKSKGLLSMMLSLPDEWNYTTRGLASICKEGVDAIGASLKELETEGYIVRTMLRDEKGRITDTQYVIYEQPHRHPDMVYPDTENPDTENPDMDNPEMDKPDTARPRTENPAQLNTYRSKTKISNTHGVNPNPSNLSDGIGNDEAGRYREIVKENIEYAYIRKRFACERLDEIVELVVETLCSAKATICISGDDYPADLVKQKLLKLDSSHIEYVFDCLDRNTTYVRNIKKYLLATLFNAPSTIDSYYAALVNHDMHNGSPGRKNERRSMECTY